MNMAEIRVNADTESVKDEINDLQWAVALSNRPMYNFIQGT